MNSPSETLLRLPVKPFRQRVMEIMPDLRIDTIELNQDGLINDVVIINKSLVFRFTKEPRFNKYLATELRILDLVKDRINLAVPTTIYRGSDFIVYPYLDGQPFVHDHLKSTDESTQIRIAEQLGHFLYTLHTTPGSDPSGPIPQTIAPVTREIWVKKYAQTKEIIYPLLLPYQVRWVDNLFSNAFDQPDFFEFEPALIHGDLAPYHILFNNQANTVSGVIDFGVGGIGNAALDIGTIMRSYGENFVLKMEKSYPNLKGLLPRARFGVHAIELEWVLNGLESGENFWFTAHIGGAKDIK